MNVLSLFDGMSCGQLALNRLGIYFDKYFASEIDKHAIKQTLDKFPSTIPLGDVRLVQPNDLSVIDLLLGGSPCQSFSFSGKGEGMTTYENTEITTLEQYMECKNSGMTFKGYSYLFWEYVRVLRDIQLTNPNVKFLLENVVMPKKWEAVITETLGVEPIFICSSLLTAQKRKRLYWTNIDNVEVPEDKGIKLHSILDNQLMTNKGSIKGRRVGADGKRKDNDKNVPLIQCIEVHESDKSDCVTTVQKDNVLTDLPPGRHLDAFNRKHDFRYYSLAELCRLQTVPEDFFTVSSDNQSKKMLGNGWTVDVIAHILSNLT
jgi:DNA (cytosine-5)-methyltransferase 3A